MQTHRLVSAGCRGTLALLWVMSGSAAIAQAGSSGMPPDGSAGSAGASKYLEMKVSIDATSERLVVVIPKLMKSVGAEFSIDSEINNAHLSSHLSNIKLQTALDVLLRTSDILVQYTLEKGVYHFSKRSEPLPEAPPPPKPTSPAESVLPLPPTTVQEDVDVHNVQTYDLLRVLNGLFGVPVSIDPSSASSGRDHGAPNYPNLGKGTDTGHGSVGSNSLGGRRNSQFGGQNGSGSGSGGLIVNVFGHSVRLGNPGH